MRGRAGSGLTLSHLRRPFLSVAGSLLIRQSFVSMLRHVVRDSRNGWTGKGSLGRGGKEGGGGWQGREVDGARQGRKYRGMELAVGREV